VDQYIFSRSSFVEEGPEVSREADETNQDYSAPLASSTVEFRVPRKNKSLIVFYPG